MLFGEAVARAAPVGGHYRTFRGRVPTQGSAFVREGPSQPAGF